MHGSYNNNSFPTNMTSQQRSMTSSRPPFPHLYSQQQKNPPLPPTQHQQSFPTVHPSTTIPHHPYQFTPRTIVTSDNRVTSFQQPWMTPQYIQQQQFTETNYPQLPGYAASYHRYKYGRSQLPSSDQFQRRNRGH